MMIDYRFATENDIENIIKAIYDIWLHQDNSSISDAIEVSEGFAYYYRNFPDYTNNKIVLAIDTTTEVIVGLAGYLDYPLLELPEIKAAQLNPVGVRKEYRRNGIAGKCSEFLCSYLKENGYSFILVCGVPYLYPQIGFHPVFSFNKAEFNLPLKLDYPSDISVEKADLNTIANVLDIYKKSKKGNLFAMKHSGIIGMLVTYYSIK